MSIAGKLCVSWIGTALDLIFSVLTIHAFDAEPHASHIAQRNVAYRHKYHDLLFKKVLKMDSEDSQRKQERLRRRRELECDARQRETAERGGGGGGKQGWPDAGKGTGH